MPPMETRETRAVPARRIFQVRRLKGADRAAAQKSGKTSENKTGTSREMASLREGRRTGRAAGSNIFCTALLLCTKPGRGTCRTQLPEGSLVAWAVEPPPGARCSARPVETRNAPSRGSSRSIHQTASMTTTSREPRSRKRSWGLVRAGMGDGRSRFVYEVDPGPEDHQCIEHHEALPQVHVREVEPRLTVLAEVEEADEADQVDGVDGKG